MAAAACRRQALTRCLSLLVSRWVLHCIRLNLTPEQIAEQVGRVVDEQRQKSALALASRAMTPEDDAAFRDLLQSLAGSKESIKRAKDWLLAHRHNTLAVLVGIRKYATALCCLPARHACHSLAEVLLVTPTLTHS